MCIVHSCWTPNKMLFEACIAVTTATRSQQAELLKERTTFSQQPPVMIHRLIDTFKPSAWSCPRPGRRRSWTRRTTRPCPCRCHTHRSQQKRHRPRCTRNHPKHADSLARSRSRSTTSCRSTARARVKLAHTGGRRRGGACSPGPPCRRSAPRWAPSPGWRSATSPSTFSFRVHLRQKAGQAQPTVH